MNTWKFIKSIFFRRQLFLLLMSLFLLSGLVITQVPQPVLAERFPPIGDDDDIDPQPPPDNPPVGGFTWSVPSRYGMDRNNDLMVDTYWRVASKDYDPNYIYPATWPMDFYGCQTFADAEGAGTNTYSWNIAGTVISNAPCDFTYNGFTEQGTYPVTLTVTSSAGTTTVFPQDVYIKDYFLVAIGDSLASGEGNPDRPQRFNNWGVPEEAARWQDGRCHRSAYAYPSKAAMALEYADPHTSVTFISFACSGSHILRPAWDPVGLQWGWPPLNLDPDPSKYRGIGLLGPYIGMDWDNYSIDTFIPSQISQLQNALTPPEGRSQRQFDSLIISAGGNDLHFGDIAMTCLFQDNCYPSKLVYEDANTAYDMATLINRALTPAASGGAPNSLPDGFAALAAAIHGLTPEPTNVYITQYADQTRGDVPSDANPRYCNMLFDILYPLTNFGATSSESGPLSQVALGGLNDAIQDATELYADYGWKYVDGISSYEVDPDPSKPAGTPGPFSRDANGYGHGYCASDNWIVRADESVMSQGPWPARLLTDGTLHPNAKGIEILKNRLLYYMLPDLESTSPGTPVGDPPTFSSSFTSGALTSQPGENGWFTGSCDSNQSCAYSRVVMQVTATGTAPLEAANVYVNDLEGCSLSGVSCPTTVITATNQLVWDLTFTNDGIYQMQFSVSDSNDQIAFYNTEIKVDLHPPYYINVPGDPFSIDEGSSITLTAVASDTMSAIVNLDWDLDHDNIYETGDEQPSFSAASLDGPAFKTVLVRATDGAGNFVITTAWINVLNVAPIPEITGAPTIALEGSAIALGSTVSDPGTSDTFTYAWTVEKDGVAYVSGSEANFSFTPNDNGSYEVSLSVTDDDGDVGTANQTILVTNVAPTATISGAPTTEHEGTAIALTSSVTDPGISDTTFTYAWTVKKDGTNYGSGTDTGLSFTPDDNGSYVVSLSVTDKDGGVGTASKTISVTNVAPALSNVGVNSASINEGASVTLSMDISDPASTDSFSLTIDWGDGSALTVVSLAAGTQSYTRSHTYADDNPTGTSSDSYAIALSITDDDGGTDTDSSSVVVNNLAPVLSITSPASGALYAVNSSVSLSGSFTDAGSSDTFTCSITWADGSAASTGLISNGACSASHTFTAAGVYIVQMTVADDDTGSTTESVMVVVYDPRGGFVTGGGWINSLAGAYKLDLTLTGKATFGFVSKYTRGQTVPTGNTAFNFDVAGLSFASQNYEWLVVNQNGTNAQFKGSGLLNGMLDPNGHSYKFMVWAGDGSPDTFRIRIWYEDATGQHDVYDNGVDQPIGGGNIVVHTGN